jgi:thiol:disulfide interchange protein
MIPVFIPSFYAHILNALLMLAAIVVVALNWKKIRGLDAYALTKLFLMASIAIGVHGLSHQGLERTYNYNPLMA